jgi:hypothetical protein
LPRVIDLDRIQTGDHGIQRVENRAYPLHEIVVERSERWSAAGLLERA